DRKVVKPREEGGVPVSLTNERIDLLLEGQLDVEPEGAAQALGIHRVRAFASGESKRLRSTVVACSEKSAKFTPRPSNVAPNGEGKPGQTRKGGTGFSGRKSALGALTVFIKLNR